MRATYLEGGKICTAHGVRGALKTEHFCDSPRVLASAGTVYFLEGGEYRPRKVLSAAASGQFVIMTLEGICDREAAIAERGKIIYLHRDDIPVAKGDMLIADMIGLPVFHAESGEPLGVVSGVNDTAGRRIYEIDYGGRTVLLPGVKEFIKEIDEESGMRVLPIPGLFDEADEV